MRPGPIALLAVTLAALVACDSTEPLRPELLEASSAVQQSGIVGDAVPVAPSVRVTTARGQAVAGVDVTFAVTGGGGTLASALQKTAANGVATAPGWTLGTQVGTNSLSASVAGIAAPVQFTVDARHAAPSRLVLVAGPVGDAQSGALLPFQPSVEIRDRFDNVATTASGLARVEVASGTAQLSGITELPITAGRVVFSGLVLTGTGTVVLRFSTAGLDPIQSTPFQVVSPVECPASGRLALDFSLGQSVRYTTSDAAVPACFSYDHARNQGQQFLVLFENMPLNGSYTTAVYPSTAQSGSSFTARIRSGGATNQIVAAAARVFTDMPARAVHSWDFGEGPIYEIEPEMPAGGVTGARLLKANGQLVDINSSAADPLIGDTLVVMLEGISRLGILAGNQKVVVRYMSNELIIAEDARLGTLTRPGGSLNTPLTQAQMSAIATEYAALARVQSDNLFQARHNNSTEAQHSGRVVAVHSLMDNNTTWGYTYSTTNYFVWDFWVGVANGATPGSNQRPERIADNLFMHEIAHMRHVGLLQRNGVPLNLRGNRWLVEGFARFTERLPIAHRILGTATPSRTQNIVLPPNPVFAPSYFRDDVPTYLSAGNTMFGGYESSSYVFDYFADQVALGGGDWMQAVRELLLAAGQQTTLDGVVGRWLTGLTFTELFTRARIALYADDIGTPLPAWTQYYQYQLRASRPPGSALAADPRNAWPRLVPSSAFDQTADLPGGAAFGYVIDGTQTGAASGHVIVETPRTANGIMSVTRIR